MSEELGAALVAMRAALAQPGMWTQGHFALLTEEESLSPSDPYFTDHPVEVREAAGALEDEVNAALSAELRAGPLDIFDPDLRDARMRKWVGATHGSVWKMLIHLLVSEREHLASLADEALLELYNEKPGRTQAEVVALLDSAIAKQRARIAANPSPAEGTRS